VLLGDAGKKPGSGSTTQALFLTSQIMLQLDVTNHSAFLDVGFSQYSQQNGVKLQGWMRAVH
jgi:hypothetical protein